MISAFTKRAALAATAMGVVLTSPAFAQDSAATDEGAIVVTARRVEERLQDVPISITVFQQEDISKRNIVNSTDLAVYTPSLSVNSRFGPEKASFAIRGFVQDLATAPSVGVYFADVVAPRSGGATTSGEGAGVGNLFDLQNVQVLKGPQGTLFGRNTTGGAIQLVPKEPTTKFEGYLEQSVGNYNMRRTQAVLNVPITDNVRARFGLDTQKRDGYVVNTSDVGPDRFSNLNYVATRASLMWDISDSVSNYTIFTNTYSKNNGSLQGLFGCNPKITTTYTDCEAALTAQGGGFYTATNNASNPDPVSKLKEWRVINKTTWDVNDDFTIKNNLAYAHLEQTTNSAIFGYSPSFGSTELAFFPAGTWSGIPSNSQNTLVEELQFSGSALDDDLTWQGGLYYEHSTPDGVSGALSPAVIGCDWPLGSDASTWNCPGVIPGYSQVNSNLGKIEYTNKAAYAQGTYDISDEFRVTLGLRYTIDDVDSKAQQTVYNFTNGKVTGYDCLISTAVAPDCTQHLTKRSEAPTWLIDFDYTPTPDVLVYTKYARGYRQGSISPFSPEGYQTYDPEKVDAYEIGSKTTFYAPVAGTFNVAVFYNKLKNQQLQVQYQPCSFGASLNDPVNFPTCYQFTGPYGSPTTSILNGGQSTIQGVEVETTLKLLQSLVFNLSYTYLETRLDSQDAPPTPEGYVSSLSAVEGGHLSFSPRHSLTTGLNYELPVPADIGDISAGMSYSFTSDQEASATTLGTLPSQRSLNLNLGWKAIAGSAFDASFFMTNALNEEHTTYVAGLYDSFGPEFRVVGEPRMWGVRVKYNFLGLD